MKHLSLSLSLCCTLGLVQTTQAAAANKDDLLDLSLTELLNVRITSSTLNEESRRSVPSSVTIYTRNEIRALGINSLAELMNYVPGYQSARNDTSGFNQSYSSRGRRSGGTSSPEILILLDGLRLNDDFLGSANNTLVNLDNVDRVEFIRGSGSSIYGSNALMGVVNVITRSENEAQGTTGSFGQYSTSGQLNIGEGDKNLQAFANHSQDKGEHLPIYNPGTHSFTPTQDPILNNELYVRGTWGELSMNALWNQLASQQFYVSGAVDNQQNSYQTESSVFSVKWDHHIDERYSFQAQLAHADRQFHLRTSQATTIYDGGIKERDPQAQFIFHGNFDTRQWLLGLEYRHPELYNTDTHALTGSTDTFLPQAPENSRTIKGYFGQYQQALTADTSMIAGGRFDDYSDFGGHFSPRLGLIHQLAPEHTLKLLYGEAFRAPSRIETSVQNSGAFVSNPDLKPEVAKTTELIWLVTTDRNQLSTTLFHSHIHDAISEVPSSSTKRTWQNDDESTSGLEVEWQATLTSQWSTRMAVTRLVQPSSTINSEASTLVSGSIVFHSQRWLASLRGSYMGPRKDSTDTDGNANTIEYTPIDDHFVLNAHLGYEASSQLEYFANARNLLNTEFIAPAGSYRNTVGVPERGRSVNVGLRWKFN